MKRRRTNRPPAVAPVVASARFFVAQRFEDQLEELKRSDPVLRKRCRKAIERLIEAPNRAGSKLEPITGVPGTFTARVSRNYRLLLHQREDTEALSS
jgi:hypothetical protein